MHSKRCAKLAFILRIGGLMICLLSATRVQLLDLLLKLFSVSLAVEYSSCFISVLNLEFANLML